MATRALAAALLATRRQAGSRLSVPHAGAALNEAEILPSSSGAPVVTLTGHAKCVPAFRRRASSRPDAAAVAVCRAVFDTLGLKQIKLSISHSEDFAVAQVRTYGAFLEPTHIHAMCMAWIIMVSQRSSLRSVRRIAGHCLLSMVAWKSGGVALRCAGP